MAHIISTVLSILEQSVISFIWYIQEKEFYFKATY
jgi:hypothetical protein